MIENISLRFSLSALLIFLISGLLLFLGFRLLLYLLNKKLLPPQWQRPVLRLMPPIEGLIWILFTSWGFLHVFKDHFIGVLGAVITGVTFFVWFAWFGLRDFVAGIVIRVEGMVSPKERIMVLGQYGEVYKLGFRSLHLLNQEGDIVAFPYSSVVKEMRVHSKKNHRLVSHTSELTVSKELDLVVAEQQLKEAALSYPWSLITKQPEIGLKEEKEKHYLFSVKMYLLSEKHRSQIITYFQSLGFGKEKMAAPEETAIGDNRS